MITYVHTLTREWELVKDIPLDCVDLLHLSFISVMERPYTSIKYLLLQLITPYGVFLERYTTAQTLQRFPPSMAPLDIILSYFYHVRIATIWIPEMWSKSVVYNVPLCVPNFCRNFHFISLTFFVIFTTRTKRSHISLIMSVHPSLPFIQLENSWKTPNLIWWGLYATGA
jgi:hypothetical protein